MSDVRTAYVSNFCNLHQDALLKFAAIGEQLLLEEGVTIYREGAASSGVFVICTGQVKLSCTSKAGRTLILKIANPGEVLGLGSVLSGTRHLLTAETLQPSELKSVSREEFLPFLEDQSEAGFHAAKALSEEYKTAFFDPAGWRCRALRRPARLPSFSIGEEPPPVANLRCVFP